MMISPYRLGDLVIIGLNEDETNAILRYCPNSIGSKYILEKKNNNLNDNINIITKIVLEKIEENLDFMPKNIEDSTVIHLRLGDVVAGNAWHEKMKRPLSIEHIKSLLVNNTNKIYVIGKCFFAEPSSTNYEECINESDKYLQNMIYELQAEHFDSGDADIDLCCAVMSKVFIQGKGFFSKLIVEIRKNLNRSSIETSVCN